MIIYKYHYIQLYIQLYVYIYNIIFIQCQPWMNNPLGFLIGGVLFKYISDCDH